jgi:hypothetical protein
MGNTVRVAPGALGATLRAHGRGNTRAIKAGIKIAASRARDHLKSISPVDTGLFKNAWAIVAAAGNYSVENDSPYAGIIERGARPHKVNREGVEAIREWVRRKVALLGPPGGGPARMLTKAEAGPGGAFEHYVDEITWAIIKTIEKKGQKGLYLVRNNLTKFLSWLDEEVQRQLDKASSGGSTGGEV